MTPQSFSPFAKAIMEQKYAHDLDDEGRKETWEEIAHRVATSVMKSVGADRKLVKEIERVIAERKFMPGGRYLYASGRPYHQVQNCLLMRAEDSREGWAELMEKATMALMSGAGIGVDYSSVRPKGALIRKTGGHATGPTALMQMVNEAGRFIMQGGSRRSAIWAGLNWKHPDCVEYVGMKNWPPEVRRMKEKDYNFPAVMDGTNISVLLDDEFFKAHHDEKHTHHALANTVYWSVIRRMLKTAEPGFSVDVGPNKGETLRNACVPGETLILTDQGYREIKTVVGMEINVWNGEEWSAVIPKQTGEDQSLLRVVLDDGADLVCTPHHVWLLADGGRVSAEELKEGDQLLRAEFPVVDAGAVAPVDAYTQGFYEGDGVVGRNLIWVYAPKQAVLPRLKTAFVSPNWSYGRKRARPAAVLPKGSSPLGWSLPDRLNWLAGLFDADGTVIERGGIQLGTTRPELSRLVKLLLTTVGAVSKINLMREAGMRRLPDGRGGDKNYLCAPMERVLIPASSVQRLIAAGLVCNRLDLSAAIGEIRRNSHFVQVQSVVPAGTASAVFCFNEPRRHMGVFDGVLTGQCTEVSSRDDSDVCNLGSINMARVESLEEMEHIVRIGTAFLLAGTVYSDVPYAKVDQVRTKNRRLGLGLMGLHEWLLRKGKKYGPDDELAQYLDVYAQSTEVAAKLAGEWGISAPVKTRAIAPTGTIGIVAETTTGAECIFCVAYKRRYLKGQTVHFQYVIDPTAKRLIDGGVDPELIEDAYVLAEDIERRVAFQAWLQGYVDHGISSTLNLPAWGSEFNNDSKVRAFGNMLIKYLPKLRGITCYPDGARGGQPLTPVKYATAIKHTGEVFVEGTDVCDITKGSTCG